MSIGGIIAAVIFTAAVAWRFIYLYGIKKKSRMELVGKYIAYRGRKYRIKAYHLLRDEYELSTGDIISYRTIVTLLMRKRHSSGNTMGSTRARANITYKRR